MTKVLTINGEKIATLGVSETRQINVTDDDEDFFRNFPGVEMQLHFGDNQYSVTMSLSEYQRMVDDGVMK